ncbi:MAG: hypothetical protein MI808_08765 [Pseudomonadales bacterium]|nr:hypothetical protein [Pseudomonadales bacterium]
MEEARNLKGILYPLSRDIRNLKTFLANINNILQADPERFALAASPGLMTLRKTLKSLSVSTKAMQDVNEITLRESVLAEEMGAKAFSLVLQPAAQLRATARVLNGPVNQAHSLVTRLNGYLNPMFVFGVSVSPEVELMRREVLMVEQRLSSVKKSVGKLTDHELIQGLPQSTESRLAVIRPQLSTLEEEVADIAEQMALLMGKMNHVQKLCTQLQPLLRMAAAMDGAIQQLVPAMTTLKHLGAALSKVRGLVRSDSGNGDLSQQLEEVLNQYDLPMDALVQLEFRLRHHVEHFVEPVLVPLSDMVEQFKGEVPSTHQLHGLESTLVAQQNRFAQVGKRTDRLFDEMENLILEANLPSYAAS